MFAYVREQVQFLNERIRTRFFIRSSPIACYDHSHPLNNIINVSTTLTLTFVIVQLNNSDLFSFSFYTLIIITILFPKNPIYNPLKNELCLLAHEVRISDRSIGTAGSGLLLSARLMDSMSSGNTEFWITYENKYTEIVEDILSGYDQSIGRSWDWSFWEKFCVRMMNECKFEAFPNMIESCMNYCDYLKKIHKQMKYPTRVQPSSRPHIEALKSMYKDRLGNIFDVCRPTTSKARTQRKKSASMLCINQSSSGGILSVKRSSVYKQVKGRW
ncbi:hypothetical protein R6Q59_036130 [Mikania micrantha]